MRVFFPFIADDIIGGSHISALNLITGFDRARVAPLIGLHRKSDALEAAIRERGLDFEYITHIPVLAPKYSKSAESVGPAGYAMRAVPAAIKYLRAQKIDLVHTNDGRMHATWAAPSRLAGARLIWHHRGSPTARGVNYIAPLFASGVVSVSAFSKPARPVLSLDRRFNVVRSPMQLPDETPDKDAEHAALCRELGVPNTALLLGYVGLLNTRKRPVHFVDAVAKVREALPDRPVHGLVFGRDETSGLGLEEACRARAEALGVQDHVHLMGFRNPITPAMAGLDALLVTALNEPFGRTLIEAMRLETPVIATRHGGNIEAIDDGKTGFLVDPDDPVAFVDPVVRLASDAALRRSVTATARAATMEEFTCEYAASAIEAIYAKVLA